LPYGSREAAYFDLIWRHLLYVRLLFLEELKGDSVMRQRLFEAATILVLAGCAPSSTEKELSLTFAPYSSPVKVDTNCDKGGCSEDKQITARLAFDTNNILPQGTSAEIEQYRVEYDLTGLSESVQYFAAPLSVTVTPDQDATFSFRPAGNAQREALYQAVGDKTVNGTATLQLAGYDDHNDVVIIEKDFKISFGDFSTGGK
jgi:hypothetical protein